MISAERFFWIVLNNFIELIRLFKLMRPFCLNVTPDNVRSLNPCGWIEAVIFDNLNDGEFTRIQS